jgi:hypothetical protein
MGHQLSRCEIIDLLEEAVTLDRPVAVELRGNRHFTDHVREVVTRDGQDWGVFRTHEPVLVEDIHHCARGEPLEPTYRGKRG